MQNITYCFLKDFTYSVMSFVYGLYNAHCKLQKAQLSPRYHMMITNLTNLTYYDFDILQQQFHA